MNLVDTPKPNKDRYAKTVDGKINLGAYRGVEGVVSENGLNFNVKVREARVRFGHLDLLCTPIAGNGERWVEYKNIVLTNDPAQAVAPTRALDEYDVVTNYRQVTL